MSDFKKAQDSINDIFGFKGKPPVAKSIRDYPLYSIAHFDREMEDVISVCADAKRTEAVKAFIDYVSTPDQAKWETDMLVESTYRLLKNSEVGSHQIAAKGMSFDLIVT